MILNNVADWIPISDVVTLKKKILLVSLERQIGIDLYLEGLSIFLALTIVNCVLLDNLGFPLWGSDFLLCRTHDNP